MTVVIRFIVLNPNPTGMVESLIRMLVVDSPAVPTKIGLGLGKL